jgi:hypothetical protein
LFSECGDVDGIARSPSGMPVVIAGLVILLIVVLLITYVPSLTTGPVSWFR